MYQRNRIILDWSIVLLVYLCVLLIIPVSDKIFFTLHEGSVDVNLNLLINSFIVLIFASLLIYLLKRKAKLALSSYIWLAILFIISAYFLMNVQATKDRLHFVGYGILSLVLYRALRHNVGTRMLYVYSSCIVMLFAVCDELCQLSGVGGRTFEFSAILIDWLSSLIGQAVIALVVRPRLEAVDIRIRKKMDGLKKQKDFRK